MTTNVNDVVLNTLTKVNKINPKSNRKKSAIYSDDNLWKLERQLDAIQQHTKIALAMVRKEIAKRDLQTSGYLSHNVKEELKQ